MSATPTPTPKRKTKLKDDAYWQAQLQGAHAQYVLDMAFRSEDQNGVRMALEAGADPLGPNLEPTGSFPDANMVLGFLASSLANKEERLPELLKKWFVPGTFTNGPLWAGVIEHGWPLEASLKCRPVSLDDWGWVFTNIFTYTPRHNDEQLLSSMETAFKYKPKGRQDFGVAFALLILERLNYFSADCAMQVLEKLDKKGLCRSMDFDQLHSDTFVEHLGRSIAEERGGLWDERVMKFALQKEMDLDLLMQMWENPDDREGYARLEQWCGMARACVQVEQVEAATPQINARGVGRRF